MMALILSQNGIGDHTRTKLGEESARKREGAAASFGPMRLRDGDEDGNEVAVALLPPQEGEPPLAQAIEEALLTTALHQSFPQSDMQLTAEPLRVS